MYIHMIKIISKPVEAICKRLLMRYNHKNASVFFGRRTPVGLRTGHAGDTNQEC